MMNRVFWAFGRQHYATRAELVDAVTKYNDDLTADSGGTHDWDPERVVVEAPRIRVLFEAMWKNEDDILDVTIEAGPDGVLRMADILYALDTAGRTFFADANHCYFEGLSPLGDNTFRMHIGS